MRRFLLVLVAATLLAAMGGFDSAAAQGYGSGGGSLVATPSSPRPGGTVEITGSGYEPGSEVRVVMTYTSAQGAPIEVEVATVSAGPDGTFSSAVPLPAEATGTVEIRALGTGPDGVTRVLTTTVLVSEDIQGGTGSSGTGNRGTASSGTALPRTGSPDSTWPLVIAGAALVTVGIAVAGVAARRRAHP
jgi:LPXTG-motif cell wall-anchored protein